MKALKTNSRFQINKFQTVRRTILVFAFLFQISHFVFIPDLHAQAIPQNPNKTNAEGKREGTWTIALDKNMQPIGSIDSASYYRIINYVNGTPKGIVKNYYRSHKIRMTFFLLSEDPMIYDSLFTVYYNDGNIEEIAFFRNGNFDITTTIKYIEKLLKDFENTIGKNHVAYANTLNGLGLRYRQMTNQHYTDSIVKRILDIYTESANILIKTIGKNSLEYTQALDGLSRMYEITNDKRANILQEEAIQIRNKLKNNFSSSEYVYHAYYDLMPLANRYSAEGKKEKALATFLEINQIMKEARGKYSYDYLNTLIILISNSLNDGNTLQARISIDEMKEISNKLFPQGNSPFVIQQLDFESRLYFITKKYQEGIKLLNQILSIQKDDLVSSFMSLTQLLIFYAHTDSVSQKKVTLSKITGLIDVMEEKKLKISPSIRRLFPDSFHQIGDDSKATRLYLEINKESLKALFSKFPSLSEQEKDIEFKYYQYYFSQFNSFVLQAHPQFPELRSEMYNLQLATKAILLNSTAKWKQRIVGSGDRKLRGLFDDWEKKRQQFAKFSQMSIEEQKRQGINLDSLEEQINDLEKVLSQRSELFASLADRKQYTWKDVQAKLKQGEAAIEIIKVNKDGVQKIVTDSSAVDKDSVYTYPKYPLYGLTDTIYYAALIVTPQTKTHPDMVLLTNGNDLEGKYLNQYSKAMKYKLEDKNGYTQFWQKIKNKLQGVKKIYFSPDGVYHQINLNTLKNPQTGKYVIDEIQVVPVTNTKDIVLQKKEESANTFALLFGSPDYQLDETSREKKVKELNENVVKSSYLLGTERGSMSLAPLPSTKIEVENISKLLQAKGYTPQVYLEGDALEENLKNSFKPSILHIATHGFFESENKNLQGFENLAGLGQKNPLLRSGLMLAGAGYSLSNPRPLTVEEIISGKERIEDGILTAYEAMNLNLDNTELVVLSACETGLGEVMNGEGVYGLQRAFKVAGARSILMSLWKVDDKTTQELMTLFYEYWLAGNSKQAAFKMAQMKLREKYKMPYYWGCFVMVGE